MKQAGELRLPLPEGPMKSTGTSSAVTSEIFSRTAFVAGDSATTPLRFRGSWVPFRSAIDSMKSTALPSAPLSGVLQSSR